MTESSVGGPSNSLSVSLFPPTLRSHVKDWCSFLNTFGSFVSSVKDRAGLLPPRCWWKLDGFILMVSRCALWGHLACSSSYTWFNHKNHLLFTRSLNQEDRLFSFLKDWIGDKMLSGHYPFIFILCHRTNKAVRKSFEFLNIFFLHFHTEQNIDFQLFTFVALSWSRLMIVSICGTRNGQEFSRKILSIMTTMMLYQCWKPRAWLSFMKNV